MIPINSFCELKLLFQGVASSGGALRLGNISSYAQLTPEQRYQIYLFLKEGFF